MQESQGLRKVTRKRKQKFLRLGDFNEEFNGWILSNKGIESPEGELFNVGRLRYLHWQGQILARLRYKMNAPFQGELF